MEKYDTVKDTIIPNNKMSNSLVVVVNPLMINFRILRVDAPNIIGIAIKKENSALALLETPDKSPPIMVDPEREVPGTRERI